MNTQEEAEAVIGLVLLLDEVRLSNGIQGGGYVFRRMPGPGRFRGKEIGTTGTLELTHDEETGWTCCNLNTRTDVPELRSAERTDNPCDVMCWDAEGVAFSPVDLPFSSNVYIRFKLGYADPDMKVLSTREIDYIRISEDVYRDFKPDKTSSTVQLRRMRDGCWTWHRPQNGLVKKINFYDYPWDTLRCDDLSLLDRSLVRCLIPPEGLENLSLNSKDMLERFTSPSTMFGSDLFQPRIFYMCTGYTATPILFLLTVSDDDLSYEYQCHDSPSDVAIIRVCNAAAGQWIIVIQPMSPDHMPVDPAAYSSFGSHTITDPGVQWFEDAKCSKILKDIRIIKA